MFPQFHVMSVLLPSPFYLTSKINLHVHIKKKHAHINADREEKLLYNSGADMLKAERTGRVKSIRYRQKCVLILDFMQ